MKYLSILFLFLTACTTDPARKEPIASQEVPNTETTVYSPDYGLYKAIRKIDTHRPDAISQALLTYKTGKKLNSPVSCDRDMVVLKDFAIRAAIDLSSTGLLDSIRGEDGRIAQEDERKFNRLGYHISYVEGAPYFSASPSYLLENLKACLSGPMITFMEEFDIESKNLAVQGEALSIDVTELERRILFWDRFMRENPEFILLEEARTTYHFFLSLYMTGTGSSRAFSPEDMQFNPEFRKSYERMITSHKGEPTADFIQGYYDVLRANNFYYSREVDQYFNTVRSPFYGK